MPRGVKAVAADGTPAKARAPQKRVFHFIIDKEILASGDENASPVVEVFTDARKLVDFMFGSGTGFDKAKHAHFKYEVVSRSPDAAEPEMAD